VPQFTISLLIACIFAEEIVYMQNWLFFAHFRPLWPGSCITHRPLPTYQISFKS